jgi:hypothetical protein
MLALATETKGGAKKSLLFGFLCCLNPKVGCSLPTGKTKMTVVKSWIAEGHDCIEFKPQKGRSLAPIIVWDPAPLLALYSAGPLDSDDMRQLADDVKGVGRNEAVSENIAGIEFSDPNGALKVVVGKRCSQAEGEQPSIRSNKSKSNELDCCVVSSLQGTWCESLSFVCFSAENASGATLQLHLYSSQMGEDEIPKDVELDLLQKMVLINPNSDNVYGGKRLLEQKMRLYEKIFFKKMKDREQHTFLSSLQLLLALEIDALGDAERAQAELTKYCTALHRKFSTTEKYPVHPLLLLAFSRIGVPALTSLPRPSREIDKNQLLLDFAKLSTSDMLKVILTEDEKDRIDRLKQKHKDVPFGSNTTNQPLSISPKDVWENMKDIDGLKSDAMEDLLKMTGLRKVKQTAVELFKQGLVLSRMDEEIRKLNAPALNYVFYGKYQC